MARIEEAKAGLLELKAEFKAVADTDAELEQYWLGTHDNDGEGKAKAFGGFYRMVSVLPGSLDAGETGRVSSFLAQFKERFDRMARDERKVSPSLPDRREEKAACEYESYARKIEAVLKLL